MARCGLERAVIHLPASLPVEISIRSLGPWLPDPTDPIPVLASFSSLGGALGPDPVPCMAWAKLRIEDEALRAGLRWTEAGREFFYRNIPEDSPLELAYAASFARVGGDLERILMLVVRVKGTVG